MGVALSRRSVDFKVLVKTGDVKGAGTDSNVYIVLVDEDGDKSRNVLLDCNWRNDFEQGNTDTFQIRNVPSLGHVKTINLWRDTSGVNDDWFVEYIKIKQYTLGKVLDKNTDQNSNTVITDEKKQDDQEPKLEKERKVSTQQKVDLEFPFPINRWIEPNRMYTFIMYDSLLPQFDNNIDQRTKELEEKCERYCLKGDSAEAPRQVCIVHKS